MFLHRVCAWLCACLLPSALAAADNLIFNGGFELDAAGYELVRYQRLDRNPTLAFEDPVVDTATFHSGSRSLRVPNRHGEYAELFARGVTLKQGTRYSLSVWMKSEKGGLAVNPTLCGNGYYPAKGGWFTVGTTWQKYAATFTTGANEVTGNAVWFAINSPQSTTANDLWIDDFQVYEDPSTGTGAAAFTYSADVEAAALVDKMIYSGACNLAAVTLELKNGSTRAVDGSVDLRLEEDSGAAPRVVGTVSTTLAAGERKVIATTLALPRFGSFTLVPVPHLGATTATLPACFAVVPQYTAAQMHIDLDTTFCVGACTGMHPGRGGRNTLRGCGGPATKALDVFAMLGGRLARLWDAGHQFDWRTIEPTQGHPDFTQTDFLVNAMYSRGIAMLPVVGGDFLTNLDGTYDPDSPFPQWLVDLSPRSQHTKQWLLDLGTIAFLPSDSVWRSHVGALAQRYQGKITHWEITNEPDIWIPAAEYMPYLKSASEVIKAADPAGQPLCFGGMETHLAECVALGAENYAAINSFHPYGSRALGSSVPADQTIAGVLAKTTMKPWLTELYYLAEGVEWGDATVVHPIHVARRFLTDLGEGVGQSTPLADEGLWRRTLNPDFHSRDANSSFLPSANLVAYDALACTFEGAKPKAKIRWDNDTICYVYERNGAPVAACWVFRDGAADRPITLPASLAATTVLDTFGNTVANPGGAFTLGQMPQYLVAAAGVATVDFIAALQAAAPLQVAATPTGVSGPGKSVLLQATVTPWPGRSVSTVAFTANGTALGNGTYNTTTKAWEKSYTTVASASGVVTIDATATDSVGRTSAGTTTLVVGAVTFGNNGAPWAVPTSGVVRIPAADFDQGGEGLAFHEYINDTGNGDWLGRSTGTTSEVDLYRSAAEGLRLGGVNNGEWINYTLNVPTAGKYDVRLRVSNEVGSGLAGAQVSLKWKGSLVVTQAVVPQTSDWDVFTNLDLTGITLTAGSNTLQVYCDTWGWSYAWLEIGPSVTVAAGNRAPTITTAKPATLGYAATTGGTVQLAAIDTDHDPLTWSLPLAPTNGTASVDASGRVNYLPAAGFTGSDSFQVRVADGRGGSDTIRVDCAILPTATVKPLVAPAVVGAPVLLAAEVVGTSEVATVAYYVDGLALGTGSLRDCGWGAVWTPATAGSVQITARATDLHGVTGPLSAALAVKVVATGTAFTVTDDCGTAAPPVRAGVRGIQITDAGTPAPFGDATMLFPATSATAGQVTWVVPHASALWFSYALTAGQPGTVTVETSPDGLTFTPAPAFSLSIGASGGWTIYDAAVAPLPAGTNQVRVTLNDVGAAQASAMALLWVQIDSVAGGGSATPVVLPSDFRVRLEPVAGQGGQFQLVFGPVQTGWTYTPEFCTDLATGNWVRLTAFDQNDNGTQRTITDRSAVGARRFYRIRATPAP